MHRPRIQLDVAGAGDTRWSGSLTSTLQSPTKDESSRRMVDLETPWAVGWSRKLLASVRLGSVYTLQR